MPSTLPLAGWPWSPAPVAALRKHSFIKTRRIWFCYGCNKQFSLKVGNDLRGFPISLDKWMLAMWMLANCKNGVSSSYEMASTNRRHAAERMVYAPPDS
jgi:transposase-like protein